MKVKKINIFIILIYIISIIIFNIHIEQYQSYVQEFPDEYSHIAYIAYLEQTGKIIPEFDKMQEIDKYKEHLKKYQMEQKNKKEDTNEIMNENTTSFLEGTTNHLGHPPLYYQIMRIFNLVQVQENGIITYKLKSLRNISQIISNIALILVFIYAYRNLKSVTGNFIFSIILVNIPLLPYASGAISNDVLSFLGLSIFLLGTDNLIKKRRGYITYILIAIGVFICMMNKVTAGVILIISIAILLIYLVIKEKNLKFILNKKFFVTLPIYIIILVYYIIIIQRYGTIQPTIQLLNNEYYKTTSFYNSTIYAKAYSLKMYAEIYWDKFIKYWAGYNYGKSFPQHEFLESLVSGLIFVFPIISLILTALKKKQVDILNLSICIGIYGAIAIQFTRQYIEFKTSSGYLGGYHSRYYLCGMSAFIILISKIVDNEKYKKIKITGSILALLYATLMQWILLK